MSRVISKEVAHVIRGDVQRLQVHRNAGLLGDFRALLQGVEHGAELHRVAESVIVVDNHPAVPQAVGVDGDRPCPYLFRRFHRPAEEGQIRLLLVRIDHGELRVPVESGNADSGGLRRPFHRIQVLVRPAPELHEVEAVLFRRLEPLQKGKFAVHGFDAD